MLVTKHIAPILYNTLFELCHSRLWQLFQNGEKRFRLCFSKKGCHWGGSISFDAPKDVNSSKLKAIDAFRVSRWKCQSSVIMVAVFWVGFEGLPLRQCMGCSQSSNQVAPAEKSAANEKKGPPLDFASTTASGASPSLEFNSIGSDDSGQGRPNARAVKFFGNPQPSKVRRLSVASLVSYSSSVPDNTSPSPLKMALRARLDGFSIDTSRAKSNSHVVSVCSSKLGLDEFPDGRKDGRPASIYWHNVVYSDLKSVVKSPESRVNKFPV
uniref:DUF4005 domain-containing protein n=1 Tax=Panagrellus redivivus TaxID=6233 RepID=A0A7E4V8V7_PANRE